MFSGIVEAVGTIREVVDRETTRRMHIEVGALASELALGDSVSVDGACLTVVDVGETHVAVDVIGTTLERTIAGGYGPGTRVNLERAIRVDARLDGHIVQGHVDAVGELIRNEKSGEYWRLDFRIPTDVHAQTIEHGSITLNGVSLTVSELLPESGVRIGVIPFTHEHTNLGALREGDPVNVEGDLIGKYVARILAQRGPVPGPAASETD